MSGIDATLAESEALRLEVLDTLRRMVEQGAGCTCTFRAHAPDCPSPAAKATRDALGLTETAERSARRLARAIEAMKAAERRGG